MSPSVVASRYRSVLLSPGSIPQLQFNNEAIVQSDELSCELDPNRYLVAVRKSVPSIAF